ncbi:P-loop containing nucleoside triphosphate hydrolase protein [Trichoderma chlorosporum]
MGANGSKPVDRSRRVKIIGAGYPRTGTTTLVLACERLLNGQGLHGGSHGLAREDEYNRKCYELYKYRHDKPRVLQLLKELTEGFVVTSDIPFFSFVPELCELYPDAQVVYVKRDPKTWWRSMGAVASNAQTKFLSILFWPVPGWRWCIGVIAGMGEMERESYNPTTGKIPNEESMERHMQSVIDRVPKDRLHIVRLEDGWAPLCKILDCPIPDAPFPKANDAENAEKIFQNMVKRSLTIWMYYFMAGTCLAGGGWWLWKNLGYQT